MKETGVDHMGAEATEQTKAQRQEDPLLYGTACGAEAWWCWEEAGGSQGKEAWASHCQAQGSGGSLSQRRLFSLEAKSPGHARLSRVWELPLPLTAPGSWPARSLGVPVSSPAQWGQNSSAFQMQRGMSTSHCHSPLVTLSSPATHRAPLSGPWGHSSGQHRHILHSCSSQLTL